MADKGVENKVNSRWIAVSTKLFDDPSFKLEPFTEREAWLWLIMQAAWRSTTVREKGKLITLERGQLRAGRNHLANQWQWGPKRVRNFIDLLAASNMVHKGQSRGQYSNIITICNYDKYQWTDRIKGQSGASEKASAGPERGQSLTIGTNNTIGTGGAREEKSDWEKAKEKIIAEYEERAQ